MNVPQQLKYTKTHEWVKQDAEILTVGVSDFAQHQLSDLTFVELPEVDREVMAEEEAAVVESVKAASDVFTPVSGTIIEVNERLADEPELVNRDPYGEGWLFKMTLGNQDEVDALLSAEAYAAMIPSE